MVLVVLWNKLHAPLFTMDQAPRFCHYWVAAVYSSTPLEACLLQATPVAAAGTHTSLLHVQQCFRRTYHFSL
jgi:hypothetical protein